MNPISDSLRNSSAEHVHWPQMTKRLSKNGLTSSWRFFLRYFGIAWLTLNWVPGWKAFSQARDSSRAGYYATISWTYQIKEINFSKFETSVFKNIKVETMISWQETTSRMKMSYIENSTTNESRSIHKFPPLKISYNESSVFFSLFLAWNFRQSSTNLLTAFRTPSVIRSSYLSCISQLTVKCQILKQ